MISKPVPARPESSRGRWAYAAMLSTLWLTACGTVPLPPHAAAQPCTFDAVSAAGSLPLAPDDPQAPEISTGYRTKAPTFASQYMAVTAHPQATQIACEVLRDGGSAVDAAVAAQMVLGLVEPQSSGIGGGAFMMVFDAATKRVHAYDGRETAPAQAGPNYLRYVDERGTPQPVVPSARESGRAVGTPGVLRMLALAHDTHGARPWAELFEPAITLARDGFPISERMARSVMGSQAQLARDPAARNYFLNADGSGKAAGSVLRNPALADTLTHVAQQGPDAFYQGELARAIVAKVQAPPTVPGHARYGTVTSGLLTLSDLAGYQAKRREPVCTPYRAYEICGFPPPSSGGIAVAQIMGILAHFDMRAQRPVTPTPDGGLPTALGVHLLAEAGRLAYADRDRYVADTDFVPLPGSSPARMLEAAYLQQRAQLIDMQRSMGTAQPGNLGPVGSSDSRPGLPETTHFSIVDRHGNAVAMTTTIEGGFGSYHMVGGFLLNNQLTDFSATPEKADGPVANRVAGGKRPRSSMAPTLVFLRNADGSRGDLVMVTGSPGGGTIIQFVAKTLVATLDWNLNAQQAVAFPHIGASNSPTTALEGGHPDTLGAPGLALQAELEAMGHTVRRNAAGSGLSSIVKMSAEGQAVWVGGADPRRENLALGDAP